jgi:hypothetical protein
MVVSENCNPSLFAEREKLNKLTAQDLGEKLHSPKNNLPVALLLKLIHWSSKGWV